MLLFPTTHVLVRWVFRQHSPVTSIGPPPLLPAVRSHSFPSPLSPLSPTEPLRPLHAQFSSSDRFLYISYHLSFVPSLTFRLFLFLSFDPRVTFCLPQRSRATKASGLRHVVSTHSTDGTTSESFLSSPHLSLPPKRGKGTSPTTTHTPTHPNTHRAAKKKK